MPTQQITMKHRKSTKNTHVFEAGEVETALHGGPAIKSVYAEKSVLGVIPPAELVVTVEWRA